MKIIGKVDARAEIAEGGELTVGLLASSATPMAEDNVALKLTEEVLERFGAYAVLFYGKQLDYGTGNISKFGEEGIVIRLYDKIERLRTLWREGREPSNESIADTLYDIMGYAVIGLLLNDGVWPEGNGCS